MAAQKFYRVTEDRPLDAALLEGDLVEAVTEFADPLTEAIARMIFQDTIETGEALFVRKVDGSDAEILPMRHGWALSPAYLVEVPAEEVSK